MSDALDAARPVRAGDELDVAKLEPFLRQAIAGLGTPLSVQQFPRGHSNLTYLVRAPERELVLRRPPPGAKAVSGHDMSREYRVLSRLHPVFPLAPRALAFCDEAQSPLGVSFYVMERVRGVILRATPPQGVVLDAPALRGISEAFVDNLVSLHAVDAAAVGLGDLGQPAGYVRRQVEGWTSRYRKAQTDEIPAMESVASWLSANIPPEGAACLIHNDYKYDNLVLDPAHLSRVLAVLDWEMATLGDPLADLGTTLAYWVDPDDREEMLAFKMGLTTLPGNLNRQELITRYGQKSGRTVEPIAFYYALGLFKVCVIAQQIYFRFKQGFTKDERFAGMIFGVQVLSQQAAVAIERGRISGLA